MIVFLIILVASAGILQACMGKNTLKHLTCSIRADEYLVEPGLPFSVVFSVDNRSWLPVLYLSCSCIVPREAQLCSQGKGTITVHPQTTQYHFFCFLLPHQHLEHRFQLTLPTRGRYAITGLSLSAGDFLGLREWTEKYNGLAEVVVLPRRAAAAASQRVFGGLMGETSVQRWIHEDPILSAGFREYTGREPLKNVCWGRSLQSGKLMVKKMDHTAEERVSVLFSLWGGNAENLETCFSLCRSLCEELERQRLAYSFLHNGMLSTSVGVLPPVEAGLGNQHFSRILEGLGRAVPEATSNLQSLIRRAQRRGQDVCCYLLLVPQVTPEVRTLASHLEAHSGAQVHIISGEDTV